MKPDRKVVIVQERLPHYRVPFFEALKRFLQYSNFELVLIHGQSSEEQKEKLDEGYLNWAVTINNRRLVMGSLEFLYQPCLSYLNNCDLVVVQQENKMIVNYLLLFKKILSSQKIAFWGHGISFQANPNSLREKWKRRIIKYPDWWFAYTDVTKDILLDNGYPLERITVVNNAIDVKKLHAYRDSISTAEVISAVSKLGIPEEHKIGIYCGSLYKAKKITFLLEAAQEIKKKISNFELLILGAGTSSEEVSAAAAKYPWIHYLGAKYDREKALYMKAAQVFLIPGAVGLAILDSFVFGLPLITTDSRDHGPEIAYLRSQQNGFVTNNTINEYADTVIYILNSRQSLETMRQNCISDSKRYTIESMAENFGRGIIKALTI